MYKTMYILKQYESSGLARLALLLSCMCHWVILKTNSQRLYIRRQPR